MSKVKFRLFAATLVLASVFVLGATQKEAGACIDVITPAYNPATGECREFATPCSVPKGWIKVASCPA
ncbi:MAG: hypothetical protein HOV81_30240 [Kofleriaceae bacterium]|nr:hypothetical protein [Kofleriaceae bacterium]